MASPLLPYINSRLLIESQGGITKIDGRIECTQCQKYLVKLFLKRMQGVTTDSGAKMIPTPAKEGKEFPGAAGEAYTYRGFSLLYAEVPDTYNLRTGTDSGLRFQEIKTQPSWMLPGRTGHLKFGSDPILYVTVGRSSGLFGGNGIDDTIYKEIGGVMVALIGGELQN
jgi:hypothetical protein